MVSPLGASSAISTRKASFFSSAIGAKARRSDSTRLPTRSASGWTSTRPASIFDRSSTSSMSASRSCPAWWMVSAKRTCSAVRLESLLSASSRARMSALLSGVRSSCDMLARNSLL